MDSSIDISKSESAQETIDALQAQVIQMTHEKDALQNELQKSEAVVKKLIAIINESSQCF
jgi:hypothetical protein